MSTVSEQLKAVERAMDAFRMRLQEKEQKDVESVTARFKMASMEFGECKRIYGLAEKRAKRAKILFDKSDRDVATYYLPTFRSVEERDAFMQAQKQLHDIRAECKKELDDSSTILSSMQAAMSEASGGLELAKLELDLMQM